MNSRPVEPSQQASHSNQIGVRQLRSDLAAQLRKAGDGDRIIVTADGKPIAQLGPLHPDGGVSLWDLAGAGLIEPPRRHDHPTTPTPTPVPADVRADRLLAAVRGHA